jgi:hypothetical protein
MDANKLISTRTLEAAEDLVDLGFAAAASQVQRDGHRRRHDSLCVARLISIHINHMVFQHQ